MMFLPRIKEATNAVINISTGGSAAMCWMRVSKARRPARPEVCSLNMGR